VLYNGRPTSVLIEQDILLDISTVSCSRLGRDVKIRWPYALYNGCPTSVLSQHDILQDINTVSCSRPRGSLPRDLKRKLHKFDVMCNTLEITLDTKSRSSLIKALY
jgi:hypothetical protein